MARKRLQWQMCWEAIRSQTLHEWRYVWKEQGGQYAIYALEIVGEESLQMVLLLAWRPTFDSPVKYIKAVTSPVRGVSAAYDRLCRYAQRHANARLRAKSNGQAETLTS